MVYDVPSGREGRPRLLQTKIILMRACITVATGRQSTQNRQFVGYTSSASVDSRTCVMGHLTANNGGSQLQVMIMFSQIIKHCMTRVEGSPWDVVMSGEVLSNDLRPSSVVSHSG